MLKRKSGQAVHPFELMILGALRNFGGGYKIYYLDRLTNISEANHHVIPYSRINDIF